MAGDSRIGNPPRTGGKSPLSDTPDAPSRKGVARTLGSGVPKRYPRAHGSATRPSW